MCLLGLSFVAPDWSSWLWPGKMSFHSDNLLLSLMNSLPSAIFCPDLDHPQYGSVKIIAKNVGGKAEYKCNDGYKLYGASFRKCLYSGVWSGRLPTCKRRFPCCFDSLASLPYIYSFSHFLPYLGSPTIWICENHCEERGRKSGIHVQQRLQTPWIIPEEVPVWWSLGWQRTDLQT